MNIAVYVGRFIYTHVFEYIYVGLYIYVNGKAVA
jgi:hypothetical protein